MRESLKRILMSLLIVTAVAAPSLAGEPAANAESDPPFYLIRPGTPIVDAPPPSWSHFVVKAQSKLASGDIDSLPGWGARMAGRIRTIILADVGHLPEDPGHFALRKLGIGLCMPDQKGCDIVVSADQADELGFDLGTLEKVVLESAEAELGRGRMIVSTPTFGIYRSPTTMLSKGEHQPADINYGFLVNDQTGELRVVVWASDPKSSGRPLDGRLVEIRPNLTYECGIDVKARRLLGTIPISWSFAMQDILPGRNRTVPIDLAEKIEAVANRRSDPKILEKALRDFLVTRTTIRGSSSTDSSRARAVVGGSGPEQPERTSTAESALPGTNPEVR